MLAARAGAGSAGIAWASGDERGAECGTGERRGGRRQLGNRLPRLRARRGHHLGDLGMLPVWKLDADAGTVVAAGSDDVRDDRAERIGGLGERDALGGHAAAGASAGGVRARSSILAAKCVSSSIRIESAVMGCAHRTQLTMLIAAAAQTQAEAADIPGMARLARTAYLALNVAAMCAVTKAGKLLCWGRNQAAEVGDGTQQSPRIVPTAVTSDDAAFAARTFTMVSGFASGACALDNQGEVWCWGYNQFGQAGSGTLNDFVKRATRVPGLTGVIAVSAALSHVCVLVQGGPVRCWGRGTEGQLGDGLSQTSVAPVIVSGLSGVTNLAASQGATCAVAGGGGLLLRGSKPCGGGWDGGPWRAAATRK